MRTCMKYTSNHKNKSEKITKINQSENLAECKLNSALDPKYILFVKSVAPDQSASSKLKI